MAKIELRVVLKHELSADEMHALAIDTLMSEFAVTDDLGITVVSECGPLYETWFGRGRWPTCRCGFDPHDNAVLNAHWAEQGFKIVDHYGQLIKHPIKED